MREDEVVAWLYEKVAATLVGAPTMGDMEKAIDRQSLEVRRKVLELVTQDAASREAFDCPKCDRSLNVVDHRRPRSVHSSFGAVRFVRRYGCCTSCQEHFAPADVALGLHERARTSPRVQEIKHLAFYVRDEIDVGVEILPMKSLQGEMSSGVAYYEGEFYNVVRQGRGVPSVPLVIIGITP